MYWSEFLGLIQLLLEVPEQSRHFIPLICSKYLQVN